MQKKKKDSFKYTIKQKIEGTSHLEGISMVGWITQK
jgi:hypothetical protein